MPTDVDRQLAAAEALLDRTRERSMAMRARRRGNEAVSRLGRIAIADALIIVAAIALGMYLPHGIGFMGAMAVALLLVLTSMTLAVWPGVPAPDAEALVRVPIKALPGNTERWLESQRRALPAPARTLVDSIGVKLETLAPQLATLDESTPAATEIRKLVGEQLPELIKGYARVPEPLRTVERNGLTPDQQLAQGLQLIDEEIAEMSEQLAQGELDNLATRGRYLQIRYADEDGHAS